MQHMFAAVREYERLFGAPPVPGPDMDSEQEPSEHAGEIKLPTGTSGTPAVLSMPQLARAASMPQL